MRLARVQWRQMGAAERKQCLARPERHAGLERARRVSRILDDVRESGDSALRRFTLELDGAAIRDFRVSEEELFRSESEVPARFQEAVEEAVRRINLFHAAQRSHAFEIETGPGVRCEYRHLPIENVGLYVPGGTAPLPSTVLMLGVPSGIAGCRRRALVTPPRPDGSIDPTILFAASRVGIHEIYRVGGAQAIAALAYGTESIPRVDKIFGPGNAWVAEAKLQVSQDPDGVSCDLPAGPSEVLVIADASARPEFAAADLLAQAEHGPDSQAILVSDSPELVTRTLEEVSLQLARLPRRSLAAQSIDRSVAVEVGDLDEAIEVANFYAPEHLILQVENPRRLLPVIRNAGSVFLGHWTPEAVGDYGSGPNHVLPTGGFARAHGGVGVESFLKTQSVQELTQEGLASLASMVDALAGAEGLFAHQSAVRIRLHG